MIPCKISLSEHDPFLSYSLTKELKHHLYIEIGFHRAGDKFARLMDEFKLKNIFEHGFTI